MSHYPKFDFNKNENQRIHLEKYLIKCIPVAVSILLLVSLGFNVYLFNNHSFSQYWYIFPIFNVLYICYFGLISVQFFLGLPNSLRLLLENVVYRQAIKLWICRYIYSTDNLIEKKYKILLLNLWFLHEGIYLNTSIPEYSFWKKIIERTDRELYKNEISAELSLLYQRYEEEDFYYFFNKDINNVEVIKIIQKVYKDYECCGIVMKKTFTDNRIHINDAESILIIQDYLLTSADIDIIKLVLQKIDSYAHFDFALSIEILREILNKENRLDILLLLKEVFNKLKSKNAHIFILSTMRALNSNQPQPNYKIDALINLVDTKIEYLTMKNELNSRDIKKKVNKV